MPKTEQPAAYKTKRRWTIEEARTAIEAQRASGLSVGAFALREGLDAQRLFRWVRRVADESRESMSARPTFIEVDRHRQAEPIEVVLTSGRILRVSESVDPGAVARIAEALDKGSSC